MDIVKMNSLFEKVWWVIAVLTFFTVTYFSFTEGFDYWKFYFVVPVLAAGMAMMRRFMKNKLAGQQQQKNKKK